MIAPGIERLGATSATIRLGRGLWTRRVDCSIPTGRAGSVAGFGFRRLGLACRNLVITG